MVSRSKAFRWLWQHHDEVAKFIASKPERKWPALAETAAEDGLSVTRDTIKLAWGRVEKAWATASQDERNNPSVAQAFDPRSPLL
jgi:hypothetical protein